MQKGLEEHHAAIPLRFPLQMPGSSFDSLLLHKIKLLFSKALLLTQDVTSNRHKVKRRQTYPQFYLKPESFPLFGYLLNF